MFLEPFSNRAAGCRRGTLLRRKSAARPQSWSRYSAERLPWWPLRVGDSCWHTRRALRPKLTNLIRPSSSSPRCTAVTFSTEHCRPQLILHDMDLSLMYHGPKRIWMSSAVLHGKDAEDCSFVNDWYGGASSSRPTLSGGRCQSLLSALSHGRQARCFARIRPSAPVVNGRCEAIKIGNLFASEHWRRGSREESSPSGTKVPVGNSCI
jgi:hypothetical protein